MVTYHFSLRNIFVFFWVILIFALLSIKNAEAKKIYPRVKTTCEVIDLNSDDNDPAYHLSFHSKKIGAFVSMNYEKEPEVKSAGSVLGRDEYSILLLGSDFVAIGVRVAPVSYTRENFLILSIYKQEKGGVSFQKIASKSIKAFQTNDSASLEGDVGHFRIKCDAVGVEK